MLAGFPGSCGRVRVNNAAPSAVFTPRSAILDGDSLSITQIWSSSSTNLERRAAGYWTNLCANTFQMFTTRMAQSYATSGHKIANMLSGQSTAISYVQSNNIEAVFLPLGANDVEDTSRTTADLKTDYQTFIDAYLDCTNAPFVFVGLPTPRGDWEGDIEATRATYVSRLHQIRADLTDIVDNILASPRLKLFDSWNDLVDTGVTNATTGLNYFPKAGYMNADGIHLSHVGSHYHGVAGANAVKATSLWAAPTTLPDNTGLQNVNPGLTGTSGTKGTGITGSVADNCKVERMSGSPTAVCSLTTATINGISQNVQRIVLSGASATAEEIAFYIQFAELIGSSYAYDGTKGAELVVPIKITSPVGMDAVYIYARVTQGSDYVTKDMAFVTGNVLPAATLEWLLRTEPLTVPAGDPTRQQMIVRMRVNGTIGGAGATIDIGQPFYRQAVV
jgi:lysophospholipase L1-like esterase